MSEDKPPAYSAVAQNVCESETEPLTAAETERITSSRADCIFWVVVLLFIPAVVTGGIWTVRSARYHPKAVYQANIVQYAQYQQNWPEARTTFKEKWSDDNQLPTIVNVPDAPTFRLTTDGTLVATTSNVHLNKKKSISPIVIVFPNNNGTNITLKTYWCTIDKDRITSHHVTGFLLTTGAEQIIYSDDQCLRQETFDYTAPNQPKKTEESSTFKECLAPKALDLTVTIRSLKDPWVLRAHVTECTNDFYFQLRPIRFIGFASVGMWLIMCFVCLYACCWPWSRCEAKCWRNCKTKCQVNCYEE